MPDDLTPLRDAAADLRERLPAPTFILDDEGVVAPQFEPLADRVLLRRLEATAVSRGGLHIPASALEKLNQGEILAVGPTVEDERLVPGALVVFGKYAGDEIMFADEVLVVIREVDLFGVVAGADTMGDGGGS